jgi:hypothetical protein
VDSFRMENRWDSGPIDPRGLRLLPSIMGERGRGIVDKCRSSSMMSTPDGRIPVNPGGIVPEATRDRDGRGS